MQITLATTSKFKSELLTNAGIFHTCIKSDFNEIETEIDIYELVKKNALGKAKSVAKDLTKGIVIGVDTVVAYNNKILTKPDTLESAKENLKMLSGNQNTVITGICVIDLDNDETRNTFEQTDVFFKELSEAELDYYINNEKWILDSSGYIIENILSCFVKKIEGNYNNILGMPVSTVYDLLSKCGYKLGN